MSNSKKRRGSAALLLFMKYARPRHNPADQGSLPMKAMSAGVAHTIHAPQVVGAPVNGARRLDWEDVCVVYTVVRVLATAAPPFGSMLTSLL